MLQSDAFSPAHSGSQPAPAIPQNHLTINLIGALQIRRGDTVLDARALGGPKPRQILEILLLNLGTPVSKDRLIELLWGGRPPAEALPTLESYVSVLRRNLQPGSGKAGPLRTTTGGYVMDRTLVDLDLNRFEQLIRQAQHSSGSDALNKLRTALSLATAPLLGDELLPAWAEDERELHATRVLDATILAAETAAGIGKAEESIELAQRALKSDPLNERAWLCLILGLEQAGRHAEGLQSYERCRRAMDRELGCAPGPGLKAAYARLLQTTADGEGELSDVLSALLMLHSQLSRQATFATQPLATPNVRQALREAGNVINSFIVRAMSAA
ncbi:DNA-binding SARP family transcriptional activator [Arthrobacter pigmenti]|uniref:DNA-binding SARP family transcriptional activator n=1 Tax=Arthrobacter pigmenti TaxID=271432 RepID=A0A846RM97_9MICC|nr:BTAD domain-containing putative transcriptional regulator [Arthrobacter pigmenti]NJC22740.1 DNA-binding SARP family transcriptional activator [Arthrobacter pigmenti]